MKISDVVTREEMTRFNTRSNVRGALLVAFNWAAVALIFAIVAVWTHPLTILAAICLLGGRQLGFAALMHDCGHRLLFESQWANQHVGQWLCAYPILSDQPRYAMGHQKHHARAGTDKDPDLPNYAA
ncbi:MAG: fatty acid desaturase, partial [Myxococcota bacterium]